MKVRLLYFDDCPNWHEAADLLHTLAAEDPRIVVEHCIVDTPELAEGLRFHGSPSIHIDGRDPFAADDDPVGLSCRIYRTPSGPAGAPTLEQLRSAVDAAHRRPAV